ncbi:hypothetical protein GCM10009545_40260 [Saccharopolyspora thermophila]|uniref:Uncharacterized protein n=1 Tax=Saccharopolyspora thermophila TaxID=89367 RepID=A0ABN1D424_9PSEU
MGDLQTEGVALERDRRVQVGNRDAHVVDRRDKALQFRSHARSLTRSAEQQNVGKSSKTGKIELPRPAE